VKARSDKRARSSSATKFAPSHQRHGQTKQVHPVPFSALASTSSQLINLIISNSKTQPAASRQTRPRLSPHRQASTASTTPHRIQGPATTTTKSDATASPIAKLTHGRSSLCPRAKNAANSAMSAQPVDARKTSCNASKYTPRAISCTSGSRSLSAVIECRIEAMILSGLFGQLSSLLRFSFGLDFFFGVLLA